MEEFKFNNSRDWDSGYTSNSKDDRGKCPIITAILAIVVVVMTIANLADAKTISSLRADVNAQHEIIEKQQEMLKYSWAVAPLKN